MHALTFIYFLCLKVQKGVPKTYTIVTFKVRQLKMQIAKLYVVFIEIARYLLYIGVL